MAPLGDASPIPADRLLGGNSKPRIDQPEIWRPRGLAFRSAKLATPFINDRPSSRPSASARSGGHIFLRFLQEIASSVADISPPAATPMSRALVSSSLRPKTSSGKGDVCHKHVQHGFWGRFFSKGTSISSMVFLSFGIQSFGKSAVWSVRCVKSVESQECRSGATSHPCSHQSCPNVVLLPLQLRVVGGEGGQHCDTEHGGVEVTTTSTPAFSCVRTPINTSHSQNACKTLPVGQRGFSAARCLRRKSQALPRGRHLARRRRFCCPVRGSGGRGLGRGSGQQGLHGVLPCKDGRGCE